MEPSPPTNLLQLFTLCLSYQAEHEARMERFARTLAEIGAAADAESAFAALGRGAIAVLRGHGGAVRTFPHGSVQDYCAYRIDPDGTLHPDDRAEPPAGSVPATLFAGGPAQLIDDLFALPDPPDAPFSLAFRRRRRGMRSSVAVPMIAHLPQPPGADHPLTNPRPTLGGAKIRIGTLHVDHRDPGAFSQADLAMAQALANEAAAAIQRVQLAEAHQRQLAARAKLDGAMLVARTAAHQLNNALAPVVGYAELLTMAPDVSANPTTASYAQLIGEAAANAADLVQRLQRIVRLEETPSPLGPDKPLLDLDRSAV